MLSVPDNATPGTVLTELTAAHRRSRDAEVMIMTLAVDWADLHPALTPDDAAYVLDTCTGEHLPIAGHGTPEIDAHSIPEFAAVLGRTTAAGQQLLGDALELRHRLPTVWAATMSGSIEPWRARQVAQATRMLSVEAAAFVDREVMVAGTIGYARLAKLIAAAVAMYMPDLAEEQRIAAADQRRFDIDPLPGTNGLAALSGLLDVRRSLADGALARGQDTLDYTDDPETSEPSRRARGRQVVRYAHITDEALRGEAGLARLQNLDQPILTGQVRDWCGRPDTTVIVKPVIDQRDTVAVDQYEIPDRIAERVRLRDHRCIFPWCNNRTGDADHIIAHADG